jgi:phenylacetate-CoA ligase
MRGFRANGVGAIWNWRGFTLFALHRLSSSRMQEFYAEFVRLNSGRDSTLPAVHDSRLAATLSHAAENIPYYRERVAQNGMSLEDFPIVTKQELISHYQEFMSEHVRSEYVLRPTKPVSWIEMRTGGTTGTPTRVVHDRIQRESGRAARLFANTISGFPPGSPYIMLWGSMQDIGESRSSLQSRALAYLLNQRTLNAFRMDEQRMVEYLHAIATSRCVHVMAYVDAITRLGAFARERRIPPPHLDTIMTCAGPLEDHQRAYLEETFGARVHNKYGSRDCGDMACDCSYGRLHMYWNLFHFETVDEYGNPAKDGFPGRLLVTNLVNRGFPLVRYEIGDIAAMGKASCECGSAFPTFSGLVGRTTDSILDTHGNKVTSVFFRHLIGVVHNPGTVLRFQVIQSAVKAYEVLLVPKNALSRVQIEKSQKALLEDLLAVLGSDAVIAVRIVDHIPELENGKTSYTLNRYSRGVPAPDENHSNV